MSQGIAMKSVFTTIMNVVYVLLAIFWPIVRWVMALNCVYQFGRALYYWNTPGMYAGWTALLHYAVFVGIYAFIAIYKPK